jgi:STE24 endopeptidase
MGVVRERSARLIARPGVAVAIAVGVTAFAVLWLLAARALWRSSVPANLHLAHVDPRSYFTSGYLAHSASYERVLDIDALVAEITLLLVLGLYALRGHVFIRESGAGRIGTGQLLGMLGFIFIWLAEIPFGLFALWWERRHGVSDQGYLPWLLESFFALAGKAVFVCLALLIAMGLAGIFRRTWWVLAAPAFAALALLSTFLSVYLVTGTKPLANATTAADVRRLSRVEGIPGTGAEVQDVHRETTAPNAESVGFGPTRRVILWDTLLDGRFSRREVDVVIGHELGHLAHHHQLKRVGWLALFLLPAGALVALLTRRRGGLARPEAVPVALLVFIALQLLTMPLMNVVSRREEAEADWSALNATHDPAAARSLFQKLATSSHASPDPPTWAYLLYATHPTIVQRLAMVDAWQRGSR